MLGLVQSVRERLTALMRCWLAWDWAIALAIEAVTLWAFIIARVDQPSGSTIREFFHPTHLISDETFAIISYTLVLIIYAHALAIARRTKDQPMLCRSSWPGYARCVLAALLFALPSFLVADTPHPCFGSAGAGAPAFAPR